MNEPTIRLVAFSAVLAALVVWEFASPRRSRAIRRLTRWPGNLAVVALNTLLVRLALPLGAAGMAVWAQRAGVGLFNASEWRPWAALLLSLLAFDLVIYAQHVAFHRTALLWRLHRVHHADLDVDVTTGVRFHPGEIALSMVLKVAVVMALGAPPLSVILFEILLNATSMFNPANVAIPRTADSILRKIVVTPDMHRIHHSIRRSETDSNFGFNLSCWDRLFRTYRAEPRDGHLAMTLGLPDFRDPRTQRLDRMLLLPFTVTAKSP